MINKDNKDVKAKKLRRKKAGNLFSSILIVVLLIVGFSVLLYPTISDYWNSLHESRAIMAYDDVVCDLDDTDYEKLFKDAEEYDNNIKKLSFPFLDHKQLSDEYYSVLDVAGNGIMGYCTIPSIGVELPIYHGTSDMVLNRAIGHFEGSTLPIGGESTHSVLSAHRGLPSAKLFTDLDKVSVGDIFLITVLNKTLTYEVDQILIVEPTQLEALTIVAGQDYVTLLTCTPYGINTHRLLVRGHRIETEHGDVHVHPDGYEVPIHIVIPVIAIPTLIIVLILMIILSRRVSRYSAIDEEVSLKNFKSDQNLEAHKKHKIRNRKNKSTE